MGTHWTWKSLWEIWFCRRLCCASKCWPLPSGTTHTNSSVLFEILDLLFRTFQFLKWNWKISFCKVWKFMLLYRVYIHLICLNDLRCTFLFISFHLFCIHAEFSALKILHLILIKWKIRSNLDMWHKISVIFFINTNDYNNSYWCLLVCMKDEAPNVVNPLVESFVARHAASSAGLMPTTSS